MTEKNKDAFTHVEEATIADLQAAMEAGRITAQRLVELYLARIEALDRQGPDIAQYFGNQSRCSSDCAITG